MRKCLKCLKLRLPNNAHFNLKFCDSCRSELLRRPKTTLTPEQITKARRMIGKMPRDEIAKELKVSVSNLKRAFRGVRMGFFNKYVANPKLVQQVTGYYEKHGRRKTQDRFPGVNVRSIVERYKIFSPRQVKWTPKQIKQAAQMAGLVSLKSQATYFNRPRANRGSIVSLWMKKFGIGSGNVNGLSYNIARHYVRRSCPVVVTEFWRQRSWRGDHEANFSRKLVLWVDFAKHLKSSNPEWIFEAANSLARFQVWLHESKQVRKKVDNLIKEVK